MDAVITCCAVEISAMTKFVLEALRYSAIRMRWPPRGETFRIYRLIFRGATCLFRFAGDEMRSVKSNRRFKWWMIWIEGVWNVLTRISGKFSIKISLKLDSIVCPTFAPKCKAFISIHASTHHINLIIKISSGIVSTAIHCALECT